MLSSPTRPTATITNVKVQSEDTKRIAALEREATRYPYSSVFRETIELLRKQKVERDEPVVTITMPKETAEKLYGLLGQITKQSGFDDVFQALDRANFVLRRQRPRITFVRDNLIKADF